MLRGVRKSRWTKETISEKYSWLEKGVAPAEPLGDMADSVLSVYRVDDELTNLWQIVAALASNRDNLSNFDYVLFPIPVLEVHDFKLVPTGGKTGDAQVNQWHYDIDELSALKVAHLVQTMWNEVAPARVGWKYLLAYIVDSVKSGYLDCEKIRIKRTETKLWDKLNDFC